MTINYLHYELANGFIHHWLTAGPLSTNISDLNPEKKNDVIQQYSSQELEAILPPVDLGSLGPISEARPSLYWKYFRCLDDHLVDFSAEYPVAQFLQAWAYTGISVSEDSLVSLLLRSDHPVDLWLNGERIQLSDTEQDANMNRLTIPVTLHEGKNDLLVRFNAIGIRQTHHSFAIQIQGIPDTEVEILIPTEIEEGYLTRRMFLENIIENGYLDRYVYGYLTGDLYDKNEPIPLRFSSDLNFSGEITHRVQSLNGDIFQAGIKKIEAGCEFELARMFPLRNGPHHLAMLPIEVEYYQKKIRFERKDPFWIVRTPFSKKPYSTYANRAREALEDAAKRRNENLFIEIAKLTLSAWDKINPKVLTSAIQRIEKKQEGSIFDVLGCIYILKRFRKKHKISEDILTSADKAILSFPFTQQDQSLGQMDYDSENRQILFIVCEILAGQLHSNELFISSGKSGSWHQQHGEESAIAWMQQHGQFGFQEWDSPVSIENSLTSLSFLVDLADSQIVRDLASVLMDKIFFSLAVNSWKGMLGASQGSSQTASVLSHRLEATSGICRLMWGLGNFNESVMGTVSLACCRKYTLPKPILQIALDIPAAFWSRERAVIDQQTATETQTTTDRQGVGNPLPVAWEANKVIYKTEDYMLASVQDYYPSQPGIQEHIWQATMGPDTVVFVNHPGNLSENDAHLPNLWVGNNILPRVAQWGDVLIALHKLPEDDWLGYTHAYFPASTFDEYDLAGHWAFARKDKAYLALYASQGYEWITKGKTALRELRSFGKENTWLCHMGQEMLDGSFAEFKEKILAMNLSVTNLSAQLTSLRGDTLAFSWQGALVVNGQEQALTGFRHYENPYCIAELPANQLEIFYGKDGIRLSF